MAITDYDPIAGNNTTIGATNVAEGCSPAGLNDAIRQMMADVSGATLFDLFFPVGTIRISSDNTNPGTYLPGTTWVAVAEGRAIVGVGDNGEVTWTAGEQRGSETHTLTESEMPAHTHTDTFSVDSKTLRADFDIRATTSSAAIAYDGQNTNVTSGAGTSNGVQTDGPARNRDEVNFDLDHDHALSGSIDSSGSGSAHNNIQPSEAHYVWERTA